MYTDPKERGAPLLHVPETPLLSHLPNFDANSTECKWLKKYQT